MKRLELIQRVRSLTRDFANSIFREQDIIDFLNEGINRFKQVVPELSLIPKLLSNNQEPKPIPEPYQHLLAIYSASRCFAQDERHYQASNLMNEFETKLEEFKQGVIGGDILLFDGNGNVIEIGNGVVDYVDRSAYWGSAQADDDFDRLGDV